MSCAERFTDFLNEKGLTFSAHVDEDGDTIVDFPYKGKIAKCIFTGDDDHYLSIYLQYENAPKEKLLDAIIVCNELNAKFKWVKFYVDKDGDLMVQDDAILSEENAADEAFELLLRLFGIVGESKPAIMKALYA